MRFYVGVTDNDWFEFLSNRRPDEVNFWRPSGRNFKVLEVGGLFLFKLHYPQNVIAGGGFFVSHSLLPVTLAWNAFGENNGTSDAGSLLGMISSHRNDNHPDPTIGCTILTEPFFFPENQRIPVPSDWQGNIVSGKTYDTETEVGRAIWHEVYERLQRINAPILPLITEEETQRYGAEFLARARIGQGTQRYGAEFLARARIGQGTFRILVTDAYHRRCSITGEHTLPVLEASHIRPFARLGVNRVSNGLLLRSDLHTLFDRGYITITTNHRIEVSSRIRQEFHNGREYYRFHGQQLANTPDNQDQRPSAEYLEWHNQNIFVA